MEQSCQIRSIYQLCQVRGTKLLEMFPQYSRKPSKLSLQDNPQIIRTIPKLQKSEGSVTSERLQLESGVCQVSN